MKPLSPTEIEVIKRICEEQSTYEIAMGTYRSPRTIDGIRRSILKKTGTKTTAGMVVYAIKNGIFKV